jgi:hypothetical protein
MRAAVSLGGVVYCRADRGAMFSHRALVKSKSCQARSPGFDLAIIYEQSRGPKAEKETATRVFALTCSCENERLSGPAEPEEPEARVEASSLSRPMANASQRRPRWPSALDDGLGAFLVDRLPRLASFVFVAVSNCLVGRHYDLDVTDLDGTFFLRSDRRVGAVKFVLAHDSSSTLPS